MQIKSDELKAILELLLEHQKRLGNETFSVSHDYYWNILKEQRYDPYNKPDSSMNVEARK